MLMIVPEKIMADNNSSVAQLSEQNKSLGNQLIFFGVLILLFISIWSYWSTITLLYKDWQIAPKHRPAG